MVLQQIHFDAVRPSPILIRDFLVVQNIPFVNKHGDHLIYQPWGTTDHTQVLNHIFNETENTFFFKFLLCMVLILIYFLL